MSISLYSGTPGSYKSYHATAEILKWLSWGRNVIANYPIDATKFYKSSSKQKKLGTFVFLRNTELTVNYLINFAKKNHKPSIKAQTLLVIDEASIMFNARQFDQQNRMDWVNFFANHRHFNFDVILIAQNDRMLDRQIRGLLEYDFKHRAIKNMNLAMMIASMVCKGLFHVVEIWYPCKMKTNTQLCKFNKKKADCYDTMALFKFTEDKPAERKLTVKDLYAMRKLKQHVVHQQLANVLQALLNKRSDDIV